MQINIVLNTRMQNIYLLLILFMVSLECILMSSTMVYRLSIELIRSQMKSICICGQDGYSLVVSPINKNAEVGFMEVTNVTSANLCLLTIKYVILKWKNIQIAFITIKSNIYRDYNKKITVNIIKRRGNKI